MMPTPGLACPTRVSRRIVSPSIRLSASSGIMNSYGVAPTLAEVADIAGLVAAIVGAAAVMEARRVALQPPFGEGGFLSRGDFRVGAVAQHEPVERSGFARPADARLHRPQPREGPRRVLVANRHQHGDADLERRGGVAVVREGRDLGQRVGAHMQQPKAQHRVAKAEHAPGRGDGEGDEDRQIDVAPAVLLQNRAEPDEQQQIDREVHHRDHAPAAGQLQRILQRGRPRPRALVSHSMVSLKLGSSCERAGYSTARAESYLPARDCLYGV